MIFFQKNQMSIKPKQFHELDSATRSAIVNDHRWLTDVKLYAKMLECDNELPHGYTCKWCYELFQARIDYKNVR